MQAQIIREGSRVAIKSPYSSAFVAAIKKVPGCKWDGRRKAWLIPAEHEDRARQITAEFFPIAGEESRVEYEVVTARVWGGNTYKRTYPAGVTIDGYDVVMPWGGLATKPNAAFEILDWGGGYIRGDGRHAHDVEYTITVRVRKGARWESYHGSYHEGGFEFVEV